MKEAEPENQILKYMESFSSWDAAFDFITDLAKNRIVLVIDEFPHLAKAYSAISSIIQKYIDLKKSVNNISCVRLLDRKFMRFMMTTESGGGTNPKKKCQEKVTEIERKDMELREKRTELERKDTELQEKRTEIERKDMELQEKMARIAHLEAELAKYQ